MVTKLLCAADLHIGRRPARLPPPWGGGRISATLAWQALVECAIAERVDALLLAGDVVDQDNRYFEAYGPLGRGVRRLREAGIAVVAVAGNHDYHTLHEVAAEVGGGHLRVLGRGGVWERWTLVGEDGVPRLHVDGWSFPAAWHTSDPTAAYHLRPPDDGAPVLGLLHCDLDGREDRYAPVPAAALGRVPVAAWVLGHAHAPTLRQGAGRAPVLYPGSLLALGPRETGRHGAWLMEVAPGRAPVVRPIALSRVRYETVQVDVSGIGDIDALRGTVAGSLRRRLDDVVAEGAGPLALLSCRVRLVGRTPLHAAAARVLATLGDLQLGGGGGAEVQLVVERVEVETRPALDLEDLARGDDAPALLASLLLELDAGPREPAEAPGEPASAAIDPDLLTHADRAAAAVMSRLHYVDLGAAAGPDVRAALRRQASRLLDELMRQKEPA